MIAPKEAEPLVTPTDITTHVQCQHFQEIISSDPWLQGNVGRAGGVLSSVGSQSCAAGAAPAPTGNPRRANNE